MGRSRKSKPELTESWDAVDEQDDFDGAIYANEDEREELGNSYTSASPDRRSRARREDADGEYVSPEAAKNAMRNSRTSGQQREEIKPRKNRKSTAGPALVMPGSPDGQAAKSRASTPHFRLNQRSMTSDAGHFNRSRAAESTPVLKRMEAEYDEQIDDSSDLNWPFVMWEKMVQPVLGYVLDIANIAVNSPITKSFLAVWLIIGAIMLGANFVNHTVNNALSPLCRIPGASYLSLPFCPTAPTAELSGAAEFDKLVEAQSQFSDVLAATANGAFLPLEMKHSEASIRDLKHVVQHSHLPSRNELVFEFTGFIDTARQASSDLSKFNSRVGRAVDHILSTNHWTLSVIDGAAAQDASHGAVSKWFSRNLNIFAPFQPVALSQDVLLDQYLRHTSAVEEQILTLITSAQALLSILDNLDARLNLIAEIAVRDDIKVQDNRDDLFANLWVKLGGRRNSVAKIDKQLHLLKEVGAYRRMAWAHVNGAVIKLMAIRDNLEDLRERVALPEVIGERVPLEVHIANINAGVERLEIQRDASRKVERDSYARAVNMGQEAGRAIEAREL